MVAVKIECGCGQHYAFDVEPVNGQMAAAVACPTCGADGTAMANEIIARNQPPPAMAPAPAAPTNHAGHLRLNASDHAPLAVSAGVKVDARTLGLVDRETAETQARAKISWGDSQDEVIKYLMLQGFSVPEATELVQVLFKERLAALRTKGIGKIIRGIGMMCVPIISYGAMAHIGFISFKLLGLAGVVGLLGAWQALTGVFMVVVPKMESGDVAED
jgi:hypothetical protein